MDLGNYDVEELRRQREARKNPPEFEMGQGDSIDWGDPCDIGMTDDSAFSGSNNSMSNNNFGNMDLSQFGGSFQGNIQSTNNAEQRAKSLTAEEDRWIEFGKKVGKGAFNVSKDFIEGAKGGFKGLNAKDLASYGNKLIFVGLAIAVIGFVFAILGLFSPNVHNGLYILVGGGFVAIIGVGFLSFNYEESLKIKAQEKQEKENREQMERHEYDFFDEDEEGDDIDDIWGNIDSEEDEEDTDDLYDCEESDEDFSDSIWDSINQDCSEDEEEVSEKNDEAIDIDDAISSIREIPARTQTRQYLYEEYSKILPHVNPNFSILQDIPESSDDFVIFDRILMDAAEQVGTKEDKMPELLKLRENLFIIQLKATRPSGLKEVEIAQEVANIYSRDEFGGIEREGVYSTVTSVGSSYIINIFKGSNGVITLGDTYVTDKEFVLDSSVKKPVILGVNEIGRVWKFDAENVFSYIFSGQPRTGKSWAVVSLIVQLAMYNSPREVTFEALDVKGTNSDYYIMSTVLPHFKNFEGDKKHPQGVLSRLRYLINSEAPKRSKILEENSVLNIKDLKTKCPNVDMPYHYIIIDEMLSLRDSLSQDENKELSGSINTILTQMPNLGFRLVLVPHRVTNEIVSKTTYTLVGCIACVRADFKEISNTLEVTKKSFPYVLSNMGDMALKCAEINRGSAVFCHGIGVSSNNEDNINIYKFIGALWSKLEPDLVKDEKSDSGVNNDVSDKIRNILGVDEEDSTLDEFWDDII